MWSLLSQLVHIHRSSSGVVQHVNTPGAAADALDAPDAVPRCRCAAAAAGRAPGRSGPTLGRRRFAHRHPCCCCRCRLRCPCCCRPQRCPAAGPPPMPRSPEACTPAEWGTGGRGSAQGVTKPFKQEDANTSIANPTRSCPTSIRHLPPRRCSHTPASGPKPNLQRGRAHHTPPIPSQPLSA